MATAAFLSMWINNSPTAVMMIPIAHSVATEYLKHFNVEETVAKQETYENEDGESKL